MDELGWRTWRVIHRGYLTSVVFPFRWKNKRVVAQCAQKHQVPFRRCKCGVYLASSWTIAESYAATSRRWATEGQYTLPYFLIVYGFYIVLSNWIVNWHLAYPWVVFQSHQAALIGGIALTALIGLGWQRRYFRVRGYILGIALGHGQSFEYGEGLGKRFESVEIVCLIQPERMSQRLLRSIAQRYGVPIFPTHVEAIHYAQSLGVGTWL